MIKVYLSLFLTMLILGGSIYIKFKCDQKELYIQTQEKKIQELKKKILSQKNKSEIECFENSIYSRKRFLEKESHEESVDDIDFNSTIVF